MSLVEPDSTRTGVPTVDVDEKVEIIMQALEDNSSATFVIKEEDHTLGNSLRYIIMKNPHVDFCGYSLPHPSESKIHMRIQTDGSITAVEALYKGLDDLTEIIDHMRKLFHEKCAAGNFEMEEGADFVLEELEDLMEAEEE
ncbi:RNA polymerase subunit AC19 [Nowakowskiella sp. JEL0407]|nr:RNA polymerase subunit AC19 [Nowakowskiella sp. JEL0407]